MASECEKIPRRPPQMKGLHVAFMRRHFIIGTVLAATAGILMKFLWNDPRKAAYAEFYK